MKYRFVSSIVMMIFLSACVSGPDFDESLMEEDSPKQCYLNSEEELSRQCYLNLESAACFCLGGRIQAECGIYCPDKARSKALFYAHEKGCELSNLKSCNDLGFIYAEGIGVEKSKGKGIEFYLRACSGGIPRGCSNVGYLYLEEDGPLRNVALALKYYNKGCDGGDGTSCLNLGVMFREADGVSLDHNRATLQFKKACYLGEPWGCGNLGIQYFNGHGEKGEYQEEDVIQHLKTGCEGQDGESCYYLGLMYLKQDEGTPVQNIFTLACELGYEDACDVSHTQ